MVHRALIAAFLSVALFAPPAHAATFEPLVLDWTWDPDLRHGLGPFPDNMVPKPFFASEAACEWDGLGGSAGTCATDGVYTSAGGVASVAYVNSTDYAASRSLVGTAPVGVLVSQWRTLSQVDGNSNLTGVRSQHVGSAVIGGSAVGTFDMDTEYPHDITWQILTGEFTSGNLISQFSAPQLEIDTARIANGFFLRAVYQSATNNWSWKLYRMSQYEGAGRGKAYTTYTGTTSGLTPPTHMFALGELQAARVSWDSNDSRTEKPLLPTGSTELAWRATETLTVVHGATRDAATIAAIEASIEDSWTQTEDMPWLTGDEPPISEEESAAVPGTEAGFGNWGDYAKKQLDRITGPVQDVADKLFWWMTGFEEWGQ